VLVRVEAGGVTALTWQASMHAQQAQASDVEADSKRRSTRACTAANSRSWPRLLQHACSRFGSRLPAFNGGSAGAEAATTPGPGAPGIGREAQSLPQPGEDVSNLALGNDAQEQASVRGDRNVSRAPCVRQACPVPVMCLECLTCAVPTHRTAPRVRRRQRPGWHPRASAARCAMPAPSCWRPAGAARMHAAHACAAAAQHATRGCPRAA
jgi:hypothetical protein